MLLWVWHGRTSRKAKKESFKEQSREIIRWLHTIKSSNSCQARSHIVRDPNIISNGRINPLESEILFSDINTDPDMSFVHSDFSQYNYIVDNDRIVGLTGKWLVSSGGRQLVPRSNEG